MIKDINKFNGVKVSMLTINDWLSLLNSDIYIVSMYNTYNCIIYSFNLTKLDYSVRYNKVSIFIEDIKSNSGGGGFCPTNDPDSMLFIDKDSAIAYFQFELSQLKLLGEDDEYY